MTNLTDLKKGLRNAQTTAQKRTDEAGLRDDLDDSPVFDRCRERRKRSLFDLLREVEDSDD